MTDTVKEILYDKVDEELQKLIIQLPTELREKAETIPCIWDFLVNILSFM
jgi:hypothetical protein